MPRRGPSTFYHVVLKIIEATPTRRFFLLFTLAYLGCSLFFGLLYWIFDGVGDDQGFWECAYFSLITQSTIGFGDVLPVGFGRIIASIQGLISVIFFSVAIGVVGVRLLLPDPDSLEFSATLSEDPDDELLVRFRIRNHLPFRLFKCEVDAGLYTEPKEEEGVHIRKIEPLEAIPKLSPVLDYRIPKNFRIHLPQKLTQDPKQFIRIVVTGNYFAGSMAVEKDYGLEDIQRKAFAMVTYGGGPPNWNYWNRLVEEDGRIEDDPAARVKIQPYSKRRFWRLVRLWADIHAESGFQWPAQLKDRKFLEDLAVIHAKQGAIGLFGGALSGQAIPLFRWFRALAGQIRQEIQDADHHLLAVFNKEVVGSVSLSRVYSDKTKFHRLWRDYEHRSGQKLFGPYQDLWVLRRLAVVPHWRKRGIARRLVQEAVAKIPDQAVYLVVVKDDFRQAAAKLYKKDGWQALAEFESNLGNPLILYRWPPENDPDD
ncbi:MAG: GNAT family N-acetyltransferase [Planctomycetota bacterium]|nr:MAG: GNAT family N-acetyltransferase [Planctomycetota bacterium]